MKFSQPLDLNLWSFWLHDSALSGSVVWPQGHIRSDQACLPTSSSKKGAVMFYWPELPKTGTPDSEIEEWKGKGRGICG